MNISYRVFYIIKRNLVSHRRFVFPTLLVSLGEPLFYLVAFGLGLGAYMGLFGERTYLEFLVPGVFVASVMMSSTFECLYGSFIRMVHEKLYDPIIATPVSAEDAVAGDILWGVLRGVLSGTLMLLIALLLGIKPVSLSGLAVLIVLALLTGLLFASMSMIISSYAPNFDFFNYYSELIIMPMSVFSGVFFPLDRMPDAVKGMVNMIPLYHAVRISRDAFYGDLSSASLLNFGVLLALAAFAFYFAVNSMKRRLIK